MEQYDEARAELLVLEKAKAAVVSEAEALLEVLDCPPPGGGTAAGLNGPLVDKEGFPRADLDLYAIRTHRHRLACLRTDRKRLEAEIDAKLAAMHDLLQQNPESSSGKNSPRETVPVAATQPQLAAAPPAAAVRITKEEFIALALVDMVMPESPAASAGLLVGDRVLVYGSVQLTAADSSSPTCPKPQLSDIGAETSRNLGKPIRVLVARGSDTKPIELSLTPQAWSGPGSLGCHLMPL